MPEARQRTLEGALVLDKPPGISSHDALQAVRRRLRERSIGHLGTLDPFASGVLVLLVGRATRLSRFYKKREKVYRGTIRFGYATDTMDYTGTPRSPDVSGASDVQDRVCEDAIRGAFAALTGTYGQTPPAYSAKKVSGKPAYKLARRGQEVVLAPATVTVHELKLLSVYGPLANFSARVSAGTYLRVLAHEAGERLGVGAHLAALRRIAVGEFTEAAALSLAEVERRMGQDASGAWGLIPPQELLPEFPAFTLGDNDVQRVLHGREIELPGDDADRVKLLQPDGRLCAVADRVSANLYHPAVVLGG